MIKGRVNQQFSPIIDSQSRILILGSIPSVKSREYNFYYMHKQNRFWKLLSEIYNDEFNNNDINVKIKLLQKHKIALYDVLESCDITGSSDSSITNVKPVKIDKLIANTSITAIYLNGKKAYDLFLKYNPTLIHMAKYLPSTSPANAIFSQKKLHDKWKIIVE